MFDSIWQDVKKEFSYGNMITRIIIVNVAFFVVLNLVKMVLYFSNGGNLPEFYETFRNFFLVSSDWRHTLSHPWSLITSMFLHEGVFHILFNMLFLYWFGKIVGDLIGDARVLPLYILGGLAGVAAYFITANIMPFGELGGRYALGASAAVMAIVVASGMLAPDYVMHLLLLGPVKLKYIVTALVFIDMISLANNNNTGGHFAHLGGALFGLFFVLRLREGQDLAVPVNRLLAKISSLFNGTPAPPKARKGPRMAYKNTAAPKRTRNAKGSAASDTHDLSHQERVDSILEKIKRSGYESLSAEEKEYLFNASKK